MAKNFFQIFFYTNFNCIMSKVINFQIWTKKYYLKCYTKIILPFISSKLKFIRTCNLKIVWKLFYKVTSWQFKILGAHSSSVATLWALIPSIMGPKNLHLTERKILMLLFAFIMFWLHAVYSISKVHWLDFNSVGNNGLVE